MCAFCSPTEPEGRFFLRLRVLVLMVLAAKGFLMLFWTRTIRRPFAVSGIRCLRPQAKKTGSFCTRMCARRYRFQPRQESGASAEDSERFSDGRCCISPRVVFCSPAEGLHAVGTLVLLLKPTHQIRQNGLRIDARLVHLATPS